MNNTIKQAIRYLISFAVAAGLFYWLYSGQDLGRAMEQLANANYSWVVFSMLISVIAHVFRGWRWVLVLRPLGYHTTPYKAFLAVMVGYLANMALPRMGEISRCAVLKKTDNIPVDVSFGTVITERIIDMLLLVTAVTATILIEFDKIGSFLLQKFGENAEGLKSKLFFLGILGACGLIGLLVLYLLREKLKQFKFYVKLVEILDGIKSGLTSILALDLKSRLAYLFFTVIIWAVYYMLTYVLFFALESTAHLGFWAGMTTLIMGGIGTAMPVQGGIGFYHLFVTEGLKAYAVNDQGIFALLAHSSQVVAIVVVGLISLLLVFLYPSSADKSVPNK